MIKAALISILRHRIALAAIASIGLGWGGFEAAIRSDWFLDSLRHNAIAKLEQSFGGTVSIDEIRPGASRLAFEINGLELRAGDDPTVAPLLSVPHAAATLGWRSLLGGVTVLESLSLHDPALDVTVAEDGPAILGQASERSLISGIAVRRFELDGGQLVWNGEPYDLEFRGSGLRVETSFDPEITAPYHRCRTPRSTGWRRWLVRADRVDRFGVGRGRRDGCRNHECRSSRPRPVSPAARHDSGLAAALGPMRLFSQVGHRALGRPGRLRRSRVAWLSGG